MEGDQLVLRAGDRELWVPGYVTSAIDALRGAATARVGSLPDLDAKSQVVLARRLVLESLAYVVAPVDRVRSRMFDTAWNGEACDHDQPQ